MLVRAPVSGGESGAHAGRLSIRVGGDRAAFDRCVPLLPAMSKTIIYTGKSGNDQRTKLVNQIAGCQRARRHRRPLMASAAGLDERYRPEEPNLLHRVRRRAVRPPVISTASYFAITICAMRSPFSTTTPVAEVQQNDTDLATIAGVDGSGAVGQRDGVFESQAAARTDLGFVAGRQFDAESGRHGLCNARGPAARLRRPQVQASILLRTVSVVG